MIFDIVKKGFDSSVPWHGGRALFLHVVRVHGGAGLTARLPGLQHLEERVERQILATGLSNAVCHRLLITDY
jgi:hypothetical protein